MIRKFLSVLLVLFLLAAPAAFAEEDHHHTETVAELGITFEIAESWIDAANEGIIGFFVRTESDGAPSGITGYASLYLAPDLTGLPETNGPTVIEDWLNKNGHLLVSILVLREGEGDESAADALFPGLSKIDLGVTNDARLLVYRNDALRDAQVDEAYQAVALAVLDSFAEPASIIAYDQPVSVENPLGAFTAVDLDSQAATPALFNEAKLTMVNVWATYCGPCIEEMPYLGELSIEYADKGVQLLGIVSDAVDDETVALAMDVVKETGAAYRHLIANDSILLLYAVQYVPTTVFIDSEGAQVGEMIVGSHTKAEWSQIIDELLASLG